MSQYYVREAFPFQRSPGITAAVIVTPGLGIGASAGPNVALRSG